MSTDVQLRPDPSIQIQLYFDHIAQHLSSLFSNQLSLTLIASLHYIALATVIVITEFNGLTKNTSS